MSFFATLWDTVAFLQQTDDIYIYVKKKKKKKKRKKK